MTHRPLLLEATAGPLYWLLLAAALWVLLRGHNEPGGGFIGGLLAVAASALAATILGTATARRRMPLALGGVLLSLAAGLPALLHDRPYLTHLWTTLHLGPLQLPLSSVMLFDLGVFLAVLGTLAGYVFALLPADDPGDVR